MAHRDGLARAWTQDFETPGLKPGLRGLAVIPLAGARNTEVHARPYGRENDRTPGLLGHRVDERLKVVGRGL
ncbi:hypothetical protein CKO23_11690 [Thiocystis violacea]|nr:hypothetical protein [Thiocystis violacea]